MEMRRVLARIAGAALLLAGIAGLLFSIAGLVILDRVKDQVETAIVEQLTLVDKALTTTAEGLALANTSLSQATETIGILEQTMSAVGLAIRDTVPMVDATADLLGEQLPTTIAVTQETLYSVAVSAQVVDDVLGLITAIPFLGTERYSPEVPLSQGFTEVADSLNGIPASLEAAEAGMTATRDNLQAVQEDFSSMAQDLGQVADSLQDARSVLKQYQEIVQDLQNMLTSARQSLPEWLGVLHLSASLVLIWLGIAQLGLITQGWELIGRGRTRAAETISVEQGS